MTRYNGFITADTLVGIAIVAMVTGLLLLCVKHERAGEVALADSRSAIHLAEHAMLNLQHHQPLPTLHEAKLQVRPTTDGTAPAGFAWVKIDATLHGHRQSLVGIVPTESLSERVK